MPARERGTRKRKGFSLVKVEMGIGSIDVSNYSLLENIKIRLITQEH